MNKDDHNKIIEYRKLKGLNESKRKCMELLDIYNRESGNFDNNCLCTKDLRDRFLNKFFNWYAKR